jgi:hypothetical protein
MAHETIKLPITPSSENYKKLKVENEIWTHTTEVTIQRANR